MIRVPAERCPDCRTIVYIPIGGTPNPVEAAEKLTTHAATCPTTQDDQ
jgi:hypothetical protein